MKFRSTICASLLALAAAAASAAPARVESFDKSSWQVLSAPRTQPAIVVFTSVGCTHCPGAIRRLSAQRASLAPRVAMLVVSVDSEDDAALLRDPHYAPADRLFAFRGRSQVLQHAVNPEWRGMTPYVALLDGRGGVQFVLGEPKPALLDAWLARMK